MAGLTRSRRAHEIAAMHSLPAAGARPDSRGSRGPFLVRRASSDSTLAPRITPAGSPGGPMSGSATARRWMCATNGCATYLEVENGALVCPVCRFRPVHAPAGAIRAAAAGVTNPLLGRSRRRRRR